VLDHARRMTYLTSLYLSLSLQFTVLTCEGIRKHEYLERLVLKRIQTCGGKSAVKVIIYVVGHGVFPTFHAVAELIM
jgi:hypothetical protein